jgi:hypothetical protein
LSDWDLSGLQRLVHEQGRDAQIRRPPRGSRFGLETGVRDEEEDNIEREYDEADMDDFLSRNGYALNAADRARFLPMFVEARREVNRDLTRAARLKDYSESHAFDRNAPSPSKQIDLPAAFEFYCDKAGIKGGATGPTAKPWRPKIKAFCDFRQAYRSWADDYRPGLSLGRPSCRPRRGEEEHPRCLDRLSEGDRRFHERTPQARRKSVCRHPDPRRQGNQAIEQEGLHG